MRRIRRLPLTAAALLAAAPAWACTLCHTDTAVEVRHHVLGHDFAATAFALALPLPLLLGAIWLAGREPASRRTARTRR